MDRAWTMASITGDRADGRHRRKDRWPRSPTPVRTLKSSLPVPIAAKKSPITLGGTPAAAICGASCSWKEVAKIVPTKASATVPPIWRKNVRFEVATPSTLNGTAFWTTIVKTENVGPTPRPARNIHSQTTPSGVSAVSWVMNSVATPIRTIAPTSNHL